MQVTAGQDGIYALGKARIYPLHPETVMFVWLTTGLSRPFKEDRRALPLSTPPSSRRSTVWCPWLCARWYCSTFAGSSALQIFRDASYLWWLQPAQGKTQHKSIEHCLKNPVNSDLTPSLGCIRTKQCEQVKYDFKTKIKNKQKPNITCQQCSSVNKNTSSPKLNNNFFLIKN